MQTKKLTKQQEYEQALEKFDLDGDWHPLQEFKDQIDLDSIPHKTTFTVLAESQGRTWESSWLIPRDVGEADWVEIQRMLKVAMTTLCRLPIEESINVLDPEGYTQMQRHKAERLAKEAKVSSAVYGEEDYTPKYNKE